MKQPARLASVFSVVVASTSLAAGCGPDIEQGSPGNAPTDASAAATEGGSQGGSEGGSQSQGGSDDASVPPDGASTLVPPGPPGRVLPKGSVSDGGACAQTPAGSLPNTTCRELSVTCPSLSNLAVQLLVSRPPDGIPLRGTLLFGTGGGGTSFYQQSASARDMMERLRNVGFVVVQRSWAKGWHVTGAGGVALAACRYSTLLQWVRDNVHASGGFCASGNSAGSVEIAYALSRYGMDAVLDFAVPTGGPPLARMDEACPSTQATTWPSECSALLSRYPGVCGTTACTYNTFGQQFVDAAYAGTPCASGSAADRATLHADSVTSSDADLQLSIPVHAVMGQKDCTQAISQGLTWYDGIKSQKTIEFVVNVEHEVQQTVEGAAAIEGALSSPNGCIARPHP